VYFLKPASDPAKNAITVNYTLAFLSSTTCNATTSLQPWFITIWFNTCFLPSGISRVVSKIPIWLTGNLCHDCGPVEYMFFSRWHILACVQNIGFPWLCSLTKWILKCLLKAPLTPMDHYAPIDSSLILTPLFPDMIKIFAVGCCSHWVRADRIRPSNVNHQSYRSVYSLCFSYGRIYFTAIP
jgi:hypothetical protein